MGYYARILEEGQLEAPDYAKAAELYEKSARVSLGKLNREQRQAYGYLNFSDAIRIYKTAIGVKNPAKAVALAQEWLSEFPKSINANTEMALLYLEGIGVEKNPQKAVALLENCLKNDDKSISRRMRGAPMAFS